MTDNEEFEQAQQQFLKTRNKGNWSVMFMKVKNCCDVFIRKWLKNSGIKISNEERDDIALSATCKIMNRFVKSKEYKILNLPTVCRLATMGELYKDKEKFYISLLSYGVADNDLKNVLSKKDLL